MSSQQYTEVWLLLALRETPPDDQFVELDSVVGRERLPTWDDERNLPYLRALIKEVHRWAPIGCIGTVPL